MIPVAVKAASLGANTVNGPAPLSVVANPAFTTAAFRMVKSLFEETTSVMVFEAGVLLSSSFLHEEMINKNVSPARNQVPAD
ncbi:MAG: hypothetical protein ABI863_14470 [Ginsengibacter sp.]